MSSSSADAATSGCRWRSPSPAAACGWRSSTSARPRWQRCAPGGCRSPGPGRPACSARWWPTAPWRPRQTLPWSAPPSTSSSSSARRSTSTSTPIRPRSRTRSAAAPSTCETARSSSCAAPSTRVTALVEKMVAGLGVTMDVAFCPERIAEGRAMTELFELPQIVSSRTAHGEQRAAALFRRLTDKIVIMTPEEAELAKLFTNVWRYIKFATANQLYMMANDRGLDFERIRQGLIMDYPRAADMPGAGLAAGPCLFKDTMQLAAYNNNNFALGHTAMTINEGMPAYLVHRLEQRFDLRTMTVGILGMAFKGGSDDVRSSLSYKLRRILAFKAGAVLCTDPYVRSDPRLVPLEQVLDEAGLLIIAAPHPEYRGLVTDKPVADIWNVLGKGVRV